MLYACAYYSVLSPCLISELQERAQARVKGVTFGGLSGILRPLVQASESANYRDVGLTLNRN